MYLFSYETRLGKKATNVRFLIYFPLLLVYRAFRDRFYSLGTGVPKVGNKPAGGKKKSNVDDVACCAPFSVCLFMFFDTKLNVSEDAFDKIMKSS